jgi:hypothetical protein
MREHEPDAAPDLGGYLLLGGLFLLASAPGWVSLGMGTLFASRNPYLLLSLLGTPVGGLLLVFGTRRIAPNSRSRTAVRFAILSLAFLVLALGSELGVQAGFQPLRTSVGFCVMASSYLALATLVFLVRALAVKGGDT